MPTSPCPRSLRPRRPSRAIAGWDTARGSVEPASACGWHRRPSPGALIRVDFHCQPNACGINNVFAVSRTGAQAPVRRFPVPRCGRPGRPAEFGAWLRRPARVGFRTHPDGLEGPAYSVPRSGAATARAAPRRAACGPPRWPPPSCSAPRRGSSRRRARRGARARRRPGRRAACRWRTCRPGTASARS